ncbi:hypothetical protein AWC12_17145 [Mycolicibacterium iranicum]|uniref:Uncharacterized protein n=1 Tax=Mycolicibacterium iranicum TaxID=912594 RepID=A0A1X1WL79_MYCIR|nr:hypothetical protein AWC12_17145 [Mycolicibacterium iranicum]
MTRNAQFLLSNSILPGATVSTREEGETVTYQLKMAIFAMALVVVVSGAILGSWLYLEFEHSNDRQELVDCIRTETVAEAREPAMQVIEASILECQP